MITRRQFAELWLPKVGARPTKRNLLATVSWMQAEGSLAKFNPLATTQNWEGAIDFNWVGVKNYLTLEDGLRATAKTLNYGADRNLYGYALIRKRLRNNALPSSTLRAVEASMWGTGGLALQCLPWVKKSWEFYSEKAIGQ